MKIPPIYSLFLFVIVDVLGFSLVLPLFPYLRRDFGMTYNQLGYLQASNALSQLIAVPIIGALSDKYGRKPLLLLCISGTILSFYLFATAKTVTMLFLSRIIDGVLGGNVSLAHSYLADVTSEEERTKSVGIIGAAFGIGFIIGPPIGGILSQISYSLPSYLAMGLSIINLLSVLYFLEESLPVHQRNKKLLDSSYITSLRESMSECINNVGLRKILWNRLVFMIVFTIFELWIGIYTFEVLNMQPRTGNLYLFWYGLIYSIASGCIRVLVKRFNEDHILTVSLLLLSISYLGICLISSALSFGLILIPLGICSGISSTIISSIVSKKADPELKGGALGVSSALGSVSRIIGPTLNSFTIQNLSILGPTVICSLLCLYLGGMSFIKIRSS